MNNEYSLSKKQKERAVSLAIKFLSYRSRSVLEIQTYLRGKQYDERIIAFVVSYLENRGYLNDTQYCSDYLAYQVKYRPKSKYGLHYDLKRKGIDESIINKALTHYKDTDLAAASVKKKIRQWRNFDEDIFKKKVLNFLRYRGFDYHTCMATLYALKMDDSEE